LLLDDFDDIALRPNLQLLDGGSAERVGGAEHHAQSILTQAIREFPDAGSLPRAIHAHDKDHAWALAVGGRSGHAGKRARCRPSRMLRSRYYSHNVGLNFPLKLPRI